MSLLTTVLLLAVAIGSVFAYLNRQVIQDHFAARGFAASAEISDLTERLMLTSAGTRIFLASEPTLDGSQRFNAQCARVEHSEQGHILGCFTQQRIHLFRVTDERLNGIIEVTAAHELLHAAFSRIQGEERATLIADLTALYDELRAETPELEQRMSVYSSLSEVSFANELHSVFGTELRELPDWLEAHYSAWFEDRGLILDFFDNYHAVFDQLQTRSTELQAELEEMRVGIEARSDEYSAEVDRFNAEWNEFVRRNENFEFSEDPAEFYRLREVFYERRDALSAELQSINAEIERYEELRQELISLSELNQELEQQLDSDLAPPAATDHA